MTIDEIITYVFESPENTNANVLRSMLEELVGLPEEESIPIPTDIPPETIL